MSILYESQCKAIDALGRDESLVLACLAQGYDRSMIDAKLAKRSDRDTRDSVNTIELRIYEKLGIPKHLKATERWRRAGRLYLNRDEMRRNRLAPRPGSPPQEEETPRSVDDFDDDELAEAGASSMRGNGADERTGNGHDVSGAGLSAVRGMNGHSHNGVAASKPAKPARPESDGSGLWPTAAQLQYFASRIPLVPEKRLQLLRDVCSRAPTHYSANTIDVYLGEIYKILDMGTSRRKNKRDVALKALELFESGTVLPFRQSQEGGHDTETGAAHPEERPDGEESAGIDRSAVPNTPGCVLTFADPASIKDVRVTTNENLASNIQRSGFRLEHVIVPPEARDDDSRVLYVMVKRR